MKTTLKHVWLCAASLVMACSAAHAADDYPARPITLVMPFAAGGGGDIVSRLLAQKMSESIGQQVIVDNRPGAGGSIGTQWVVAAKPDGYTLLVGTSSTHGINPWLYSSLKYDVMKDFEPIAILGTTDYALAVPANAPAKSVADLVAQSKRARLQYASSGNGTTSHLASALFGSIVRSELDHIPYKNGPAAVADLIAARVDFMFDNTNVMLPYASGGKLRILATSAKTRSAVLKDAPTMMEAGVPNFELVGWWAVFAPARTPKAVIDKLHAEIVKAMAQPSVLERLRTLGIDPYPAGSPAETRSFVESQLVKFKSLVEVSGSKID